MNLVPIELRQNGHMHGPCWAGASLFGTANKQTVEQEREPSWSIVLSLAVYFRTRGKTGGRCSKSDLEKSKTVIMKHPVNDTAPTS